MIIYKPENPTLLSVANDLKISKDTVCKRNKKLREMGYILPFKSKKLINE